MNIFRKAILEFSKRVRKIAAAVALLYLCFLVFSVGVSADVIKKGQTVPIGGIWGCALIRPGCADYANKAIPKDVSKLPLQVQGCYLRGCVKTGWPLPQKEHKLSLTSEQATSIANHYASKDFVLKNIKIQFQGSKALVSGNLNLPVFSAPVSLYFVPIGGRSFKIENASLGFLPIPGPVVNYLEKKGNPYFLMAPTAYHLQVRSYGIIDSRLEIEFSAPEGFIELVEGL